MPAPVLAVAIWTFIINIVPALIWFVFKTIGLGFIVYQGMDLAVGSLDSFIQTQIGGLPADVISILKLAAVDKGIQIITASFVVGFTLRTTGGSFKRIRPV